MAANNFKYMVFFVLLAAIVISVYTLFVYQDFVITNIIWIAILAIFAWVVYKYDFILQLVDYQRAVIYRFGKVNRVGGPGWTWVWPVIEKFALVDLRVMTIDVPKQHVVTKDGVEITVDAIVYMKVKKDNQSVVNSIIEVQDYREASKLFIISSLRDVVGSMILGEVISNIEIINARIKENLMQMSKNWGINVESIEIKDVEIPEIVLNAMHKEKAAVQQKLARMERALAHKAEIDAVQEAASKLDDKALAYYYIKAIENMSNSKGSKVFFPSEFSKLAESFTNSTQGGSKKDAKGAEYYKDLLKNYVNGAVKKAKKAEKEVDDKDSKESKDSKKDSKGKKKKK
ncbi:MAG: SPFH domain-containing protein [archaeon]|jgi:regulator of protease activity HflC (stomatin/prohibitin superfamily)